MRYKVRKIYLTKAFKNLLLVYCFFGLFLGILIGSLVKFTNIGYFGKSAYFISLLGGLIGIICGFLFTLASTILLAFYNFAADRAVMFELELEA
ncbi:MAG: hypothetical protein ACE5K4_01120 [Candidatus Hydrothermarchaeota archaeon]